MAAFKVKGQRYEIPTKFTIGEISLLKEVAKLDDVRDLDRKLKIGDPDAGIALLYVTLKRWQPDTQLADVQALTDEEFGFEADPEPVEVPPRPPDLRTGSPPSTDTGSGSDENGRASEGALSPVTTPVSSGSPD